MATVSTTSVSASQCPTEYPANVGSSRTFCDGLRPSRKIRRYTSFSSPYMVILSFVCCTSMPYVIDIMLGMPAERHLAFGSYLSDPAILELRMTFHFSSLLF